MTSEEQRQNLEEKSANIPLESKQTPQFINLGIAVAMPTSIIIRSNAFKGVRSVRQRPSDEAASDEPPPNNSVASCDLSCNDVGRAHRLREEGGVEWW